MAKNQNDDEVLDETMTDDVAEVEETEEEPETEATDTEEEETEESETEEPEEDSEQEEETEEEPEPEKEPEKPKKKPVTDSKKKTGKKKQDEDTDAELDAFFEKLRKAKEKQKEKEEGKKAKKEGVEKTFTQAEFEKALKSALAKRLPSKEEREQFEHWRESQQTLEEKLSVLQVKNAKLEEEIDKQKRESFEKIEKLQHENIIVKAGVDRDAVEFVQYKVEQMEGDFDENLQSFLKNNKRYMTPKTTIVEAAEHKQKVKTAITKKDLDKMGYVERAKFREEHPEEYEKAMGR